MAVDLAVFDGKALKFYVGYAEVAQIKGLLEESNNSLKISATERLSLYTPLAVVDVGLLDPSDNNKTIYPLLIESTSNQFGSGVETIIKGLSYTSDGFYYLNSINMATELENSSKKPIEIKSAIFGGPSKPAVITVDGNDGIKLGILSDNTGGDYDQYLQVTSNEVLIDGKLHVSGDFVVDGNFTYLDVQTMRVQDNIIALAGDKSLDDDNDYESDQSPNNYDGLEIFRGYWSDQGNPATIHRNKAAFLLWKETVVTVDTTNVSAGWFEIAMGDPGSETSPILDYHKSILTEDSIINGNATTVSLSYQNYQINSEETPDGYQYNWLRIPQVQVDINVDNETIEIVDGKLQIKNGSFLTGASFYYVEFTDDKAEDTPIQVSGWSSEDPRYDNSILFLGGMVLIKDHDSTTYDYARTVVSDTDDSYCYKIHFKIPSGSVLYILAWDQISS